MAAELEPDWDPPHDDVRFDHARADEALAACERAAAAVRAAGDVRRRAGLVAAERWRGVFADRFAVLHAEALDDHGAIELALTRLAARIADAASAAAHEQARREALRDEWEAELGRNRARAEAEAADGEAPG